MRSAKIVIMNAATIGISLPTFSKRTSKNLHPKNLSNNTPNLPSAREIALLAKDQSNSIVGILTDIVNEHNISGFDNTPASLKEAFNMLSKVSDVLSKLSDTKRLAVRDDLKIAFQNFYTQNMNLPEYVSAKAAKRMAKALTQGPDALANLERAVNKHPQAVVYAKKVLENLNSLDSVNPTSAKQPRKSVRRAKDSVKPTPAKESNYSGRTITHHSLHTSDKV